MRASKPPWMREGSRCDSDGWAGWLASDESGSEPSAIQAFKQEGTRDNRRPSLDGPGSEDTEEYPKTSGAEMRYAVLFEKTETGYSGHVPDLPGCVAGGATLEETTDLIRGAVRMHLAGMAEDGEPIPEPKTIAEYIVAA